MNATVYTIFREYLDKTQQDPAAAASLTLADVLQTTLDTQSQKAGPPAAEAAEQPMTVAEAARWLRIAPGKVLQWIHGGELPATNIATRATGRPRYRLTQADLALFQGRRAASATPVDAPRRATRRRPPPAFPPTRHSQT
jgi:excisionase family DNA binding protein